MVQIIRGPRAADNFTIVANAALRDGRLTFKARGLLAYLLSMETGWETSIRRIAETGVDGRDAVESGLNELERLGYLERRQARHGEGQIEGQAEGQEAKSGSFRGMVYVVQDEVKVAPLTPVDPRETAGQSPRPGNPDTVTDPVDPPSASGLSASGFSGPGQSATKKNSSKKTSPKKNNPLVTGSAGDRTTVTVEAPGLDVDGLFDEFWNVWPRRVKRAEARLVFEAILTGKHKPAGRGLSKPYPPADAAAVTEGARRFAADCLGTPANMIPHPTSWLNARRWEDEAYADTQARVGQVRDQRGSGGNHFAYDEYRDSSGWFDPAPSANSDGAPF